MKGQSEFLMILIFLLPLILLTIAAVNFVQIRTPRATSELLNSVGVLVPMRNEAENVEGIVTTLSAQDGSFHYYLLDDNSEDSTYELLQRFTAGDARFTVIKGAPLAAGWIGKTWALQQLFEASNEEVLVSIDADVRLTNDAINKAVTLLHGARLDFVSPYPRQIANTFAERLIQPLLKWSWLTTVPLRYAESSGPKGRRNRIRHLCLSRPLLLHGHLVLRQALQVRLHWRFAPSRPSAGMK